jgi:hypothetical protein
MYADVLAYLVYDGGFTLTIYEHCHPHMNSLLLAYILLVLTKFIYKCFRVLYLRGCAV